MNIQTSEQNLKLVTKLTLKAVYKSRYGKYQVELLNPSMEHLKRLHAKGFDIQLQYFNDRNELVKTEVMKY